MHSKGKSFRNIGNQLEIHPSTACRVIKKEKLQVPKPKQGRPRVLDKHDEKYISRLASTGKASTGTQISQELQNYAGISASPRTIMRALNRCGIKSRYKKKKPQLSKTHRRRRREFEISHRHWSETDWDRVLWSDETKICLTGSDGRERTLVAQGESLRNHNITPTKKFGGGSIMIWACMFTRGVGFLCRVDGGVDAPMYLNILRGELMQTLRYYHLSKQEIIFQQDNASCHTARLVKDWFDESGMQVMSWPAQSPDLNPIEHLWDHLKKEIRKGPQPNSLDELWERIQDKWEAISADTCKNLVRSMSRRLEAVRKAKGGYTRY